MVRRRVAVLAADIAGYTKLMEADEEATHARLMWLDTTIVRPHIAAGQGRIVKHTGDGFLAAFESAPDAADCALAIQEHVARIAAAEVHPPLLFRMGLNLTDAIVEPHDIFGDGVNLAARLQQSAEPGGLVVSALVAELLRGRVGITLADLGSLSPKHLSRPVRAFAVRRRGAMAAPIVLPRTPRVEEARPSIAILPFFGDAAAEDSYFADGVTEGIVHVLSGIEHLAVISRGSTLRYAGQACDPRQVGRDLGVRYVMSGSMRRRGSRLRITTELSECATGTIVRADRRDGALTDLFEMQDSIAAQVVGAIAPAVRHHELKHAMRKHPNSLTGYDLMLRALDLLHRLDRAEYDRARGFLQQAIALDSGYAPFWSHAAFWHMLRIGQGWSDSPIEDVAEASRCALTAITLDGNHAVALAIHGQMLSFTRRDYAGAREFLDRATTAGPSCAMAWAMSSATYGYCDQGELAVAHARLAVALAPADPFAFADHMLSQALYVLGVFDEAVHWGRVAAARNPRITSNLRTLAASLTALGEVGEARQVARKMLEIEPSFRVGAFAQRTAFGPAVRARHLPRLLDAGFPE